VAGRAGPYPGGPGGWGRPSLQVPRWAGGGECDAEIPFRPLRIREGAAEGRGEWPGADLGRAHLAGWPPRSAPFPGCATPDARGRRRAAEGLAGRPRAPNLPGKSREGGAGPAAAGGGAAAAASSPSGFLPSPPSLLPASSSSSCMSQAFPGDSEQPRAARAPGAVAEAAAAAAAAPGPSPRRAPASRARTDHGEGGPGRRQRRGQQLQQPQQQPRHLGGLLALLLPGGPGGLGPVGDGRAGRRGQPQQPGLGGR
jgi:hypothetical protein